MDEKLGYPIQSNAHYIAIIGMAGRFPGADNLEKFWENLENGVDSIAFFGDKEAYPQNSSEYQVGAFGTLNGIELFDPFFFDLSTREATLTDPQRRFLLECSYEALENAGYPPGTCEEKVAVYIGEGENGYLKNHLQREVGECSPLDLYGLMIGNQKDFAATQISYKLNLKGPSVTIATTCSTSLVAIHEACKSLLSYESHLSLAGGVSICIPQDQGYRYEKGGIFSPDGRCRAFDERAQGTVQGNGIGLVVLKRLDDAIEDNDTIHAVICGSAVNNDGAHKVGYTAPSIQGQSEAISEAHTVSGIDPESIGYIEAHGTGTSIGDPIEIQALTEAFKKSTCKTNFCAIGSVKANIGHLDVAAGVAGLIKATLALKKKKLPPQIHFEKPNSKINFSKTPFYVNTQLKAWKASSPRRAAVSSFGIGGTNAHVVLEEFSKSSPSVSQHSSHLLLFSAKTETSLQKTTHRVLSHLSNHPEISLPDVAFTLQKGREHFKYRQAIVCKNKGEVPTQSDGVCGQVKDTPPTVVFMFPGQGNEHLLVGKQLYKEEKVFKDVLDRCLKKLQKSIDIDLKNVLFSSTYGEAAKNLLKKEGLAEPLLFSIEYALSLLWISWGVKPQALIGYGIGEYVAACLAKVLDLEDMLSIITYRGKLIQGLPKVQIIEVFASEAEIVKIMRHSGCDLIGIDGSFSQVVAGSREGISKLIVKLHERRIQCQPLTTSHPFHSRFIEPILDPFLQHLQKLKFNDPEIPFISNFTGKFVENHEVSQCQYWIDHLRNPIRFIDGIKHLTQNSQYVYLEVGPNQVLKNLVLKEFPKECVYASLESFKTTQADKKSMLSVLGKLWVKGVALKPNVYQFEKRKRIPLPTYPFDRKKCWIDPPSKKQMQPQEHPEQERTEVSFYLPSWKQQNLPQAPPLSLKGECWLVFASQTDLEDQTIVYLKETKNIFCITIQKSTQFEKIDDATYQIDPSNLIHYQKLFDTIQKRGRPITHILHMWSFGFVEKPSSFEQFQDLGYMSLVNITKYFGEQSESIRLLVISHSLSELLQKRLIPEKSTILGACKTIPQEYTHIQCSCIDLLPKGLSYQSLGELIIDEFNHHLPDNFVTYRGGSRWVQDVIPLKEGDQQKKANVKTEGIYLITGGLGKVGLIFAKCLAKRGAKHLLLVGRSSFPKKGVWENFLKTHGNAHPISSRILQLQCIEKKGAQVHLFQADVSDFLAMETVVSRAEKKWGALCGVVHAAGNIHQQDFHHVKDVTKFTCEKHYVSKVQGANVISQLLSVRSCDFVFLISSLSTILGGIGYSTYAAANLYMDAFAYQQNGENTTPWTTLNLDGLEEDEKGSTQTLSLSLGECYDAFQTLLSLPFFPQFIIAKGELKGRIKLCFHKKEGVVPKQSSRVDIEKNITTIWEELLGVENINPDDNFYDLGGDSLLLTRALLKIAKKCHQDLFLSDILKQPTIKGILNTIKMEGPQCQLNRILPQKDVALCNNLPPITCHLTSPPKTTLITGTTGFLGSHLLADLHEKSFEKLYCLIRAQDLVTARAILKRAFVKYRLLDLSRSKKIIPILGDLSQPNLGIKQDEIEHLSNHIDSIYHVGACVHHIYDYEKLRAANVLGTMELIKFSIKNRLKHFHFVSSISAAKEQNEKGVFLERFPEDEGCGESDGYSQTKWVCEKLLSRASSLGLPVTIYRPCTITGRSLDGVCNPANDHLMKVIKGCIQMGAAPTWPLELNIMPVDIVSTFIMRASLEGSSTGKVYNMVGKSKLSWIKLIEWLKSEGYFLTLVSDKTWRSKYLSSLKRDNAIYPLLAVYLNGQGLYPFYGEDEQFREEYDSRNTKHMFDYAHIDCPEVDGKLFSLYISYLYQSQFLEGPPT